jgi:hypothetical protein
MSLIERSLLDSAEQYRALQIARHEDYYEALTEEFTAARTAAAPAATVALLANTALKVLDQENKLLSLYTQKFEVEQHTTHSFQLPVEQAAEMMALIESQGFLNAPARRRPPTPSTATTAKSKRLRKDPVPPKPEPAADTKWCRDCQDYTPRSQFSAHPTTRDRLGTYCRPHQTARATARYRKHRDRINARRYAARKDDPEVRSRYLLGVKQALYRRRAALGSFSYDEWQSLLPWSTINAPPADRPAHSRLTISSPSPKAVPTSSTTCSRCVNPATSLKATAPPPTTSKPNGPLCRPH